MRFRQQELDVCGVTAEEFEEMLILLSARIGSAITQEIEARHQLDVALICRVCTCAALVRALGDVIGFDRVVK